MSRQEKERDKLDALLNHAMRRADIPQPPPGFARTVAQQAADLPEQAHLETWLTRLVMAIVVFAVGAFAIPFASAAGTRVFHLLEGAPWPLLLSVGAILAAMKLMEFARSPVMTKA